MKQIVFSTHNENKLNEIKKILSDNFKILGLSDLYAGAECNSEKNIEKVLNRLSNKKCRKAVFKTVICLVFSNEKYFFEGKIYGSISSKRMGKQGFGYDPIFIPNGFNKTFSQMSMEEKNKISHRAIAVEKLSKFLYSRVTT